MGRNPWISFLEVNPIFVKIRLSNHHGVQYMDFSGVLEKFGWRSIHALAPPCCSFCQKKRKEVKAIIAGQSVAICDQCLVICCDCILGTDAMDDIFSAKELFYIDLLERLMDWVQQYLPPPTPQDISCSFCAKHSTEVRKIVTGPEHAAICNECVYLCLEILSDKKSHPILVLY